MIQHFDSADVMGFESFYRRNLINCLSGYKSLNLIGSIDSKSQTNLAPFSQVFHIGASPPLLGVLFRPHTVKRDTLENILETGVFTLNQVTSEFYKDAHWTSASWEGSEFDKTGLKTEFLENFEAPFVAKSLLKLACRLVETQTLKVNDTVLVIGSIEHIFVDKKGLRPDGSLDLNALDTVTVSGLDEYHRGEKLARLSYAKPDQVVEEI